MTRRPWTAREIATLRQVYPVEGNTPALRAALPRRTPGAIGLKARALGMRSGQRWTPAELATLRKNWHVVGARTLRHKLRRHTWAGICQRAARLGLRTGVPQGFETLDAACARLGYYRPTLRRILAWAGVDVVRRYPGKEMRGGGRPTIVETDAATEAVEAWLRTETVKHGAEARGVSHQSLWHWLIKAGVIARQSRRVPHRVPSEVLDRVVAWRAATNRRGAA